MQTYRCVDVMNVDNSENIVASSPDAAMKKYFQNHGISERPVRSAKQTHKRQYDCRFYTRTNPDDGGYRVRHVFTGFNREGFEFYGSTDSEFNESLNKDLTWKEIGESQDEPKTEE